MTEFTHPDGPEPRNGLVINRTAGKCIHIFFERTETVLEVISVNDFPKSADIKIISPSINWYLSVAPRQVAERLSMTEADAVHLFSGNVSIKLFCSMIDKGSVKIAFKSHPDIRIYREELVPLIDRERKARRIGS